MISWSHCPAVYSKAKHQNISGTKQSTQGQYERQRAGPESRETLQGHTSNDLKTSQQARLVKVPSHLLALH